MPILGKTKGNTVSNLSSSRALRDITLKHGGQYQASAVGEVNVVELMKEANSIGVQGVPFFVFDNKYAVSGAQPVEVFENALQQTYKETVSPFKDLSGDSGASCDADGCSI